MGERGMLTQIQIDKLEEYPGTGWISALRSRSIGKLMETGLIPVIGIPFTRNTPPSCHSIARHDLELRSRGTLYSWMKPAV